MNDLARMIDKLNRAEAEPNPVRALKILMGWSCSTCGKDFEPTASQPEIAVRFTLGLKIQCPPCSILSEEAKP